MSTYDSYGVPYMVFHKHILFPSKSWINTLYSRGKAVRFSMKSVSSPFIFSRFLFSFWLISSLFYDIIIILVSFLYLCAKYCQRCLQECRFRQRVEVAFHVFQAIDVVVYGFNPFQNKPLFLRVCSTNLLKTRWKLMEHCRKRRNASN